MTPILYLYRTTWDPSDPLDDLSTFARDEQPVFVFARLLPALLARAERNGGRGEGERFELYREDGSLLPEGWVERLAQLADRMLEEER